MRSDKGLRIGLCTFSPPRYEQVIMQCFTVENSNVVITENLNKVPFHPLIDTRYSFILKLVHW